MAPKMQAFIADLMEIGYKPVQIYCFARRGHVHGSRHYSGNSRISCVRFGSKADICSAQADVRFTPKSGHSIGSVEMSAKCQ